jgi:hypothetical protein
MKYTAKKGAKRAKRLLDAYKKIAGNRDVADVLADLRHYCDAKELNFYEVSDESYELYLTEKRP